MNEKPSTAKIDTPVGKTALDVLRERGLGLPCECGGQGACGQCRVRVLQGTFNPPTAVERNLLPAADRQDGFRLACRLKGKGELRFRLLEDTPRQLSLAQHGQKKKRSQYGIAVDLGTTTLRLALLDVVTHERVGAVQCLNRQAAFGADVMARLAYAMRGAPQRLELAQVVRDQMFEQIVVLAKKHTINTNDIVRVCVVANTAMTHLLCNEPVESLALLPYRSSLEKQGCLTHRACDWGWRLAPDAACQLMPVVGSFVGSDLLADLVAVGMASAGGLTLVLDLGTNGEVALGNRTRICCASTAAGCAFEATSLRSGVGTRPGAVWRVWQEADRVRHETLDGSPPIGFCGSGALSALACMRRMGKIDASGRIQKTSARYNEHPRPRERGIDSEYLTIAPQADRNEPRKIHNGQASLNLFPGAQGQLQITQDDVRQIQLAKGAIAAATQMLMSRARVRPEDLKRVVLIGNFGSRLDVQAALALGLLPRVSPQRVEVLQEATLLGAERVVCAPGLAAHFERLASKMEWVSLVEREDFVERFAQAMTLAPQEYDVSQH